MTDESNKFTTDVTKAYEKLISWFKSLKEHDVKSLSEVIAQAKKYLAENENLSEEKIKQFLDNLAYDLTQFYQQSKAEAQHSLYLELLKETLWDELAKITDVAQVEWAELNDDFKHQGIYKVGDVIGFGVLVCQQCQYEVEYTHVSEVIPCPQCQNTSFTRHSLVE
jgi:hypothetical protein